jgi:hypothetical protein
MEFEIKGVNYRTNKLGVFQQLKVAANCCRCWPGWFLILASKLLHEVRDSRKVARKV